MIKIKVSAIDDIPIVIDLPKSKNIILDLDTYVGVTTDTKISVKRTVLEDVLASIWYNVIINHHDDTMLEELLGITYQFFKSEKNIHIFFVRMREHLRYLYRFLKLDKKNKDPMTYGERDAIYNYELYRNSIKGNTSQTNITNLKGIYLIYKCAQSIERWHWKEGYKSFKILQDALIDKAIPMPEE